MEKVDNWKNRSAAMRCASCIHYVPKSVEGVVMSVGRCRKHAPSLNGWPVVFTLDWCGDHKLNEESLRDQA
jgi:hypothetical protein